MTKKYYWAIAVAVAFVAGTMTTGGVVYATFDQCNNDPPHGVSDGKPFLEIWQAICDLETQASNDNDTDPTNELGPVLGFYVVEDFVTASANDIFGGLFAVVLECDLEDTAISAGYGTIASLSTDIIAMNTGGDNFGGVTLEDVVDGDTFFVKIICADFDPPHI